MSSVKERLLEFLKAEGISASEFARKMDLSPAYLASMRKSMPEEKVERLTKIFPQLNRDWLLYGEEPMYRKDITEKGLDPYRLDKHIVPLIPTQAAAGNFPLIAQGVTENECQPIFSPFKDADFAIRIQGDSMEPNLQSGTILVIKKINDKAFLPWGSPLVLDTENGSVCKVIFPSKKGEDYIEARSYNPNYPPFQVPIESIFGFYRIMGTVKDGWTL